MFLFTIVLLRPTSQQSIYQKQTPLPRATLKQFPTTAPASRWEADLCNYAEVQYSLRVSVSERALCLGTEKGKR
ncbi:hypothetical protein CDAR_400461 [Caerostris darwini]|uniref:Secreted protein n=1 Tax=Caerostris darwini TaxID=1538125 RepID=A0AAV4P579_9ARAC|nr:hypothetical protein CDAR_400461 [Caerostris darwini]